MAHKTEGDCPIATNIFIRKQAEKLGVALEEMINKYAEESGTPKDTIRNWVWPSQQKRTTEIGSKDKPMKKEVGPKAPDKFLRLWKQILAVSEGLQTWADGEIKADTEDDVIAVQGIMAALPYLCRQAARVGVDLVTIQKTFEREKLFFNRNG